MADAWIKIARPARSAQAVLAAAGLLIAWGCSPAAPPEPESEVVETVETAPTPEAPKPLWQQHIDELQPEVESWARAWSNQDVEAYLAHYSPDFRVPAGTSREAWEALRRRRLTRPSQISVTLSGIRRVGYDKAWTGGKERELVKVRFRQSYQSDAYSDEVEKELELELVDLTWKIYSETSL